MIKNPVAGHSRVGTKTGCPSPAATPDKITATKGQVVTIQCPYCKYQIPANAIRCPHCTSDLSAFQAQRINDQAEFAGIAFLIFVIFGILAALQWVLAWVWSLFTGSMPKASFYWAFKWLFDLFFG
jgi:DNA-directed RNA polymerase subunit RPC12/RpoP